MINIKNIYKFIVSFESILVSSMIPINIPIPSIENIYRIVEIPINYQIPTIIFLTLIFSGEFLISVYAMYILIGLFFLPVFYDGGSLGYLLTPNFGYLIGIFPLINIINILNKTNNFSFNKYIKYTLIGLTVMHFIGISYLTFQLLIFNKANLILYNIGLFTLSKIPFQIISLLPIYLSINLIKNLKNENVFK
tara:strand:+ start:276 stop:854 length:579 start_codon:yes stop_codon:yes gene_type:complete